MRGKARATESVTGLLEGTAREVAALPGKAMLDMAPVLMDAEREIERDLRRWLATAGANAEARFTAQHLRKVLVQLRLARKEVGMGLQRWPPWLDSTHDHLRAALKAGGHAGGKLATEHLVRQLREFSKHFEGSIAPIPLSTAAMLKRGDDLLFPRFESSARRYAGAVREDLKHQFAVGVAKNETFGQLALRISRLTGTTGLSAARGMLGAMAGNMAAGLAGRYTYQAERLVRTEMINAYNVQAQEGIAEAASSRGGGGIGKRWDATFDQRVCTICRGLHGVTVPVDQPFPGGYMHPPAHPNCRCALVAWHPSWGHALGVPA